MPTTRLVGRPDARCNTPAITSRGFVIQMTRHPGNYHEYRHQLIHDIGIDPDQIIAAHPGLASNTSGHNDNIATSKRTVVVCADHVGVKSSIGLACAISRALPCGILRQCQTVSHHQAASIQQEGKGATDIASTNERFYSSHEFVLLSGRRKASCAEPSRISNLRRV